MTNYFSCTATSSIAGVAHTSPQPSVSGVSSIPTRGTSASRLFLRPHPTSRRLKKESWRAFRKVWKDKALHLRHEVIAHRPGSTTIEDSFKRANISLNDIGSLIGLCGQLIDAWAPKLDCYSHNQSSVKPDLKAVMDTLLRTRIERHAQERLQIERALKCRLTKD